MFKIAVAQINPCVGNLDKNYQKILSCISKAKKQRVDLIVFPELSLVGYPPEDLLLKPHFIDQNLKYLKKIKNACSNMTALVGFVNREKGKLYNACALLQDKKIIDVYHKIHLPNYEVFDEKRYFSSGDTLSLYSFKGYDFAISICQDVWERSFLDALKGRKFDFLVNISASPFHLRKVAVRERILTDAAKKLKTDIVYCNLVGGQDELVFDGTSKIIAANGKLISYAGRFKEDLLIFKFDHKKKYPRLKIPIKEEEEAFAALRLGLYDYTRKNGFKKTVVGISGGIDSAVVATLAQNALGKNNVYGIIMPSRFTSRGTLADAKKICRNLGIKHSIVDIDGILDSYMNELKPYFTSKSADKTVENLQARIRGNILMAFSNRFGFLVLNTGNKSELSCGYCTLYGDMVGGFGVLKDVPKMLVYKIARHINKTAKKALIPKSVLKREPSAELRPNQKDTDSLPPYKLLDPILKLYVEKDLSLEEIVKKGFNKKLVAKIIKLVDDNEYKRRQSPVGIKITPKAFGKDRRMPITNIFRY
jgi:NAD+ synthase (glutamine-hydrolysing)